MSSNNILILTTGLSGSSVLTGLLYRNGKYWIGEQTEYKNNKTGRYETFENSTLVDLNNRLLEAADIRCDEKFWYRKEYRSIFKRLVSDIDLNDFQNFSDQLWERQPWLLKDPKTWVTIGFWLQLLDRKNLRCIVLTRNLPDLWTSQVLKRIIYDYSYLQRSELASRKELVKFLAEESVSYLEIEYSELSRDTEKTLSELNQFLGEDLTLKDWEAIYQPEAKTMKLRFRKLFSLAIYLKNYLKRIR